MSTVVSVNSVLIGVNNHLRINCIRLARFVYRNDKTSSFYVRFVNLLSCFRDFVKSLHKSSEMTKREGDRVRDLVK